MSTVRRAGEGRERSGIEGAQPIGDAIIDLAHDAIISVGSNGLIVRANRSAHRIFRYREGELLGRDVHTLIPPRYAAGHHRLVHEFMGGPQVSIAMDDRKEVVGLRGDGTEFPASASISKWVSAGQLMTTVIISDLSSRYQVEARARVLGKALEGTTTGIVFINDEGIISYANRALLDMIGVDESATFGRRFDEVVGFHGGLDEAREAVTAGRLWSGELQLIVQDGGERRVKALLTPLVDGRGVSTGTVGSFADTTEQHLTRQEAAQYRERLEIVQEIAHLGNWEWNIATDQLTWSAEVYRIFGVTPSTFDHCHPAFLDRVHPEDRAVVSDSLRRALDGTLETVEFRVVRPGGDTRTVRAQGEVLRNATGEPLRMVGFFHDVTDYRRQIAEIEARERFIHSVLDAMDARTAVVDSAAVVIAANSTWLDGGGGETVNAIGRWYADAGLHEMGVAANVAYEAYRGIESVLSGRAGRFTIDYTTTKPGGGAEKWHTLTVEPLNRRDGGAVISHRDITARKRAELALEYQANHDSLTGLPNRVSVVTLLKSRLEHRGLPDGSIAVMVLDLDRFKVINDSLGHDVGDRLLELVSARLTKSVRAGDVIGRLGGDEFVIVCGDAGRGGEAEVVARRILDGFNEPFSIDGRLLTVAPSIGIAIANDGAGSSQALLRFADAAMYRAKADGGGRFRVFDDALRDRLNDAHTLENDLRKALERHELRVHYQPQIDFRSGRFVGAEALIRWLHPVRGFVSPGQFIPIAEETGLIRGIGLWVFKSAARQARLWAEQGLLAADQKISVNLSPRQLADPTLLDHLMDTIRDEQVEPANLGIEITETAVMDDPEQALRVLLHLKKAGLTVAIDDFGTGHSSLAYLSQFPVEVLKIDRLFVAKIGVEARTDLIVKNIITLANELSLAVIAEGVETHEQVTRLRRMGCGFAQGYLFGRPQSARQFEQLWRRRGRPRLRDRRNW